MAIDGQGTKAPDRLRAARTVAHVKLWPSMQPAVAAGHGANLALFTVALDQVRQTVRPDDRVCPYAMSRIAVEFGPAADAVTPRLLGQRLARAVGQGLLDECGMATQRANVTTRPDVNGHGRPRQVRATIPSTTVVTVERVFDSTSGRPWTPPLSTTPPAGDPGHGAPERAASPRLRQRAVVRYSAGGIAGAGTRRDDSARPTHADQAVGTVLVIDPSPRAGSVPGLAAVAAADLAERIGFVSGAIVVSSDSGLIAEIGGRPLDLVVLVVGSEPASERVDWGASTWSIPAHLTEAYRSKGIDVAVVSAGASVAAMTWCLEHGALAAFDLAAMREILLRLVASAGEPSGFSPEDGPNLRDLPRGAEGLLKLTGAERRVLFYLTTGRSPQTVADELVVSLATVRSHIRSVLRKLGVRSQLAAVALATSQAVAPDPTLRAGTADRDLPAATIDGG